ncbi:NAD(P)/FAD-dependent oxidoreductase [Sporobolomyces salmoneus]|uniref:NAD(P)/FAD-dependent oxidoreductase n=1 Tax=Sporobolomyces salmoneus TaxID=183962 RepID=UPI00316D0BEB
MSEDLKNVLIVGLGLSGTHTLEALSKLLPASHRIIAISPIPGYWPPGALRASVVPGFEKNTIAPLSKLLPPGSRHRIIEGHSVSEVKDTSVVLDKAHEEFGTEISFDYCVLATGSVYPFPCRPPPGSTEESIKELFQSLQSQIASSSSILVVGGGPVGLEFAGEVAEYYNGSTSDREKKKVTLVHSGKKFLAGEGWKPKFGEQLKSQLEALGVEMMFDEKVELDGRETGKLEEGKEQEFELKSAGKTIKADFLFVAFGNSPATSFLPSSYLSPSTHRVLVHPSFQSQVNPRVFAIGDISSIEEEKLYATAKSHGPIAAQNIVQLIKAKGNEKGMKEYKPGQPIMVVSVGSKGGAGQLPFGFVLGSWFTSTVKSKSLFVSAFKSLYNID